jgi:hypothetical protein
MRKQTSSASSEDRGSYSRVFVCICIYSPCRVTKSRRGRNQGKGARHAFHRGSLNGYASSAPPATPTPWRPSGPCLAFVVVAALWLLLRLLCPLTCTSVRRERHWIVQSGVMVVTALALMALAPFITHRSTEPEVWRRRMSALPSPLKSPPDWMVQSGVTVVIARH